MSRPHRVILLAISLGSIACAVEPGLPSSAETSSTGPSATASGDSTASPTHGEMSSGSSGSILDVGPGMPGDCIECEVVVASMQSGALEITGDTVLATAELRGQVVYAMGTFGQGRFIATADSSLPLREQTECPLLPWLVGSYAPEPSILVFGRAGTTEVGEVEYPPGIHLPPEYVGDPKRLAADYDLVVYFEDSVYVDNGDEPTDEELETVLAFALDGGGLIVSSEYATDGGGYLSPSDIDSVNRILGPLGVQSLAVSLNWGEVTGQIEFPCFPPVG